MIFVWTVGDAIAAAFIGCAALYFAGLIAWYYAVVLWQKTTRRLRKPNHNMEPKREH